MAEVCLIRKPIQRETFVSSAVRKWTSAIRLVHKAKSFAKISTGLLFPIIQKEERFEREINEVSKSLLKRLI